MMKKRLLLILFLVSLSFAGSGLYGANKPNIILVMTDDQGYGDLACHGHPFLKTPNIDKLYAQSARFTNYHVSPTCSPTRAALMTGKHSFRVGVTHTILERECPVLSATMISEVLHDAGYTTGIFGKWHLGDTDPYQPGKRGFDEVFIHGSGAIGQIVKKIGGPQADVIGNKYVNPVFRHNGKFVQTKGYCTDVLFKQALGWAKSSIEKKKPFFLYLPTNTPHAPFEAPAQYKTLYAEQCKAALSSEKSSARSEKKGKGKDDRTLDEVVNFYGMITNIDDNMGILMKKLDEWGVADNTVLIFCTDNGSTRGYLVYNAGMKGKKNTQDEGGSRVPLFIRYPGVAKAGTDINRLTRHYDIFPTLAEIAGAALPANLGLDGRSLLPLLKNPNAEWQDRRIFVHCSRWNPPATANESKYRKFAVRDEKFRLVGNVDKKGQGAKVELFKVDEDAGQTRDLVKQYPELVESMLKDFDKFWAETRPLMVNENLELKTIPNEEKAFPKAYLQQKKTTGISTWVEPDL